MTPVFADTSYFLAMLNSKDDAHKAAVAVAATLRSPMVTTDWVIVEVANFLSPRESRGIFGLWLAALRGDSRTTIVWSDSTRINESVDLYVARRDKNWSLTDCLSFVVMKAMGLTDALTTDHHFLQAGYRAALID